MKRQRNGKQRNKQKRRKRSPSTQCLDRTFAVDSESPPSKPGKDFTYYWNHAEARCEQSRKYARTKRAQRRAEKAAMFADLPSSLQASDCESGTSEKEEAEITVPSVQLEPSPKIQKYQGPSVHKMYEVFRELLALQHQHHLWIEQADCAVPTTPLGLVLHHMANAEQLSLKLQRLLQDHVPSDSHDLGLIYSVVCTIQVSLGSRRADLLLICPPSPNVDLELISWVESSEVSPFATDVDTTWVFNESLLPLRKKSSMFIRKWGHLGHFCYVRRFDVPTLQRAHMDGDSIYQEWLTFFDLPLNYFPDQRDMEMFFRESCIAVFSLGDTLARISYVLRALEKE
ncbi:hypothetical protein GYMLUDRAFT_247954 [Collybiopsis luxurians FD-317 M1]|uniref:Uncharacterized protein n=1 Tax=Collybiopsis luxurians FD-317 M1 TaxID=944289 RepID=A0A0D0CEL1_9AGAR|nr:hypothetical protein GYMLUDRAFT_247954 [Collybiopsis luxurians FD-317 M1]